MITLCLTIASPERWKIGKYLVEYHAYQFNKNASLEELNFIHDGTFRTILHYAMYLKFYDTAEYLLSLGAST